MRRATRSLGMAAAFAILLVTGGCYGASVGVYGTVGYGPGAWGAYPYPGAYPPMGGGVFVGVCCEEEEQDEDQDDGQDREQEDADGAAHGVDEVPDGDDPGTKE